MDINGCRILITGASGFIGSRLCEKLYLEQKMKIAGLVRNIGRAARIGRLGIDIVRCDILDKRNVEELTEKSDVVVHLAAGDKKTIIDGTKIVAKCSRKARVRKFIHMSSAAVYGIQANESHTTEYAPLKRTGNPYSDAKLKAEKIVNREIAKGLPAVILRPRIIYGPYSVYVTNIFSSIIDDKFALVDEGIGACNLVYIDNLIDAIILAIENDKANGLTFFITDDERITWKMFYEKFIGMTGRKISFENINSAAINKSKPVLFKDFGQELKCFITSNTMKNFIKEAPILRFATRPFFSYLSALPYDTKIKIKDFLGIYREEKNIKYTNELLASFDLSRLVRESGVGFTCIDKAKNILGYFPKIDFRTGSEMTKEWLKFIGLLG